MTDRERAEQAERTLALHEDALAATAKNAIKAEDEVRTLRATLARVEEEVKTTDRCWARDIHELTILRAERDGLRAAGNEFLLAVDTLCDWLNGADISADHADERPLDFERLGVAMTTFRAALGRPASRVPFLPLVCVWLLV